MNTQESSTACWQGHEGPLLAKQGEYTAISCQRCGFPHAIPIPDPEVLAAAYRETYFRDQKPAYMTDGKEDQEWARLCQTDLLEIFERVLGPGRRRLLDIGSGPGFFLKLAQDRGWQELGIDVSRQACAYARNLGVHVEEGLYDAATAPHLGKFDVVHLDKLMEHLPHPQDTLELIHEQLDPGGIVCINAPNDFSAIQKAACKAADLHAWWVAPPFHINYFSFESMEGLLARHGFDPVERTTSFPMELFLLLGENYIREPSIGRGLHNRRKRADLAFEAAGVNEARQAIYRALASVGAGRDVIVVARKR